MIARSKIAEHDGRADAAAMIKVMKEAQETLAAALAGGGQITAENGDTLTEDL